MQRLAFVFCWALMSSVIADLLNKSSSLLFFQCFLHFLKRLFSLFLTPWKLNTSLQFRLFTYNALKVIPLHTNFYQRGLNGQNPQPAQASGLHCFLWNCTQAEGLMKRKSGNWSDIHKVGIFPLIPRTPAPNISIVTKFTCTTPVHDVPRRLEPNTGTSVFIKQPFILSGCVWLPCVVFRCSTPNICRH